MAQPYTMQGRDRDYYVRTLLAEAGGEDAIGQAAAAHVIKNRLLDGGYGKSITDVVLAPKQFSAWNKDGSGNSIGHNADPNSEAYKRTAGIVDQVMAGGIPDMTKGATHYWADSGMKKLVDDGYQTNLLPKWADTMTKQRGNDGLYEHGGHKFTGRRKGYSEESFGPAPVEQVTTSGLDGAPLPLEEVMRVANRGILSANEEQWGEGVAPDDYTNQPWYFAGGGASSGGGGGGGIGQPSQLDIQTLRSNLDQSNNESQPTSMMGKLDKWLTKDRSLALLALGSGMLSSNGNFAEQLGTGGLSMANELGRQEGRDFDQSRHEDNLAVDLMKHRDNTDLQNARLKATIEGGNKVGRDEFFDRQVRWEDGSTQVIRFNKATGQYLGAGGEDVTDAVITSGTLIPNSSAAGDKYVDSAAAGNKRYIELQRDGHSLTQMDDFLSDLENTDGGAARRLQGAVRGLQSFFNAGLSKDQIREAAMGGTLAKLAGANRIDITGGGATSDKDMELLFQSIGGNVDSWLWNPDVAIDLITKAREAKLASYNANADVYDKLYEQKPDHFVKLERYARKGALKPHDDIQGILNNQ